MMMKRKRNNPLCQICKWSIVMSAYVVQADILNTTNASELGVLWFLMSIGFSGFLFWLVLSLRTLRFVLGSILCLSITWDILSAIAFIEGEPNFFYLKYNVATNIMYYSSLLIFVYNIIHCVYKNRDNIRENVKYIV